MRGPALYVAALVAVSLVFFLAPGIDLAVSGLFYRPGEGFFLKDWLPFWAIYHFVPTLTLAIAALVLAALGWRLLGREPLFGLDRKAMIFLLASLALGPGIMANTVLKDHWGRARPSQVTEFGGHEPFTPAPLPADNCARNCSFVAGHATMGFYLISFAFLAGEARRRQRLMAVGMAAGALFGLARIAQGGHFLSDVVFAGFVVYGVAWLLHRWIVEQDCLASAPMRRLYAGFDRVAAGAARLHASALGRIGIWAAATLVAVLVSVGWIDQPLAIYFKRRGPDLLDLFRFLSRFGVATGYLIGTATAFVALQVAARIATTRGLGERLRAWSYLPLFIFVSVTASGLAVDILKPIFGRSRPKLLFSIDDYQFGWWGFTADHWSFPSGHAAVIVALMTALYVLWPRHLLAYFLIGAVIALSRVVVTAHYLSDVIMAAFLAVVVTRCVGMGFERFGVSLDAAKEGYLPPSPAWPWRRQLEGKPSAAISDNPESP